MSQKITHGGIEGLLDHYRTAALKRIERCGSVVFGMGDLDIGADAVSFAADSGCETFNDDFVAVWLPSESDPIHWAAAIADGVTGSLLAQEAAELACYFGLSAIASSGRASAISQNPIGFATRLFHQLGRQVIAAPDEFTPAGCPKSVWRVSAREGKFLQTTLNLVWSTDDGIRVMAVGDGGLLCSYIIAPDEFTTHTFGTGKLQCLGPRSASVQPEAYLLEDWSGIACFTDGLAEAVEQLSELPSMLFDRARNATSVIEFLNVKHPELVNDNLSAFRARRLNE